MKIQQRFAPLITFSLIALVALVASCSDNSTSPPGGGTPAKELDSGNIAGGGGQYPHLFQSAGTFNYHCTIHGTGMAGQVIVVAGSPTSATVSITNNTYTPSPATVAPGGTVTWTNNAPVGSTHTVTSN